MNASAATGAGALAGLKVIDCTRVLGGPYCTQILADHGADVIKIEPPAGDEVRDWGPPFKDGLSAYFAGVNRNKRSLGLDLSREEGRAVLERLLDSADVLIENFKPARSRSGDLATRRCWQRDSRAWSIAGLPGSVATGRLVACPATMRRSKLGPG